MTALALSLLLSGCQSAKQQKQAKEEASWWCTFYGNCPKEKSARCSLYGYEDCE